MKTIYEKISRTLLTLCLIFSFVFGLSKIGFGQGVESFSNIQSSSSSYLNVVWTGDNGLEWNSDNTRTDQTMTGKAVCVKDGVITGLLTSEQQSAGVGSISFKAKIPYNDNTKSVTFTITCGSVTKKILQGNMIVEQVYDVSVPDINATDAQNIKIQVSSTPIGARVVIDDVVWTAANVQATPMVTATPNTLSFGNIIKDEVSASKLITVSGSNLTGDITYAIGGADASAFSVTENSWTSANGGGLDVTFSPTEIRAYAAIITLSSDGAENVEVNVSGSGIEKPVEGDIVFNADFATCSGSGGNDGTWSGISAGSWPVELTNAGWSHANGFAANKCLRAGTSGSQGHITTPELSGLNGDAVVKFRAGAWNAGSEKVELFLEIEGGGEFVSKSATTSVTMVKGAFTEYALNITNGTANTKIKFRGDVGSSRFFLDDVKVEAVSVGNTSTVSWVNPDGATISVRNAGMPVMVTPSNMPALPGGNEFINGASVENGTVINITATTEEGCTLNEILVNEVPLVSSNYTVNSNTVIKANVTWQTFTITLPESPVGYSVVPEVGFSSPVNYGRNYAFKVNVDEAYSSSTIEVKVNGDVLTAEEGVYTIGNIIENKTITVTGLTKNTYTIAVTQSENGTIAPETIEVEHGNNQTFTITAANSYSIEYLIVDGANVAAAESYIFNNVVTDHTISASFIYTPTTYTVTLPTIIGATVTPEPGYTMTVIEGANFKFKVVLDHAYSNSIIEVKANEITLSEVEGVYTIENIVINQDVVVNNVVKNAYMITVIQSANGTISPETTFVEHGDSQEFLITPSENYQISQVLIDGEDKGALSSYIFSNVTAIHTITALFTEIPPEVITFTGSGSWNVPTNWSTGVVPEAGVDVTIAGALTISDTEAISCGIMTIGVTGSVELLAGSELRANSIVNTDAAKLIVNNGNVGSTLLVASGDFEATVKQNVVNDWQLVAVPNKMAVNANNCFTGFLVHEYAEATNTWNTLTGSSSISSFKGYSLGKVDVNQFTFSGAIDNAASHTYTLAKTAGDNNGWNLLGNSWLGAIDIAKTSLNGSFYVYTNGNYTAYTTGLKNGTFNGVIPAMQGFFVQAENEGQNMTINKSALVENSSFYKSENSLAMIKFNVKGSKYEDNVLLAELSNCSSSFEYGFDARKMNGDVNAPQMYAISDDSKLSVNASNSMNYTHLGFNKGSESNYTLSWTFNNIGNDLWLYDSKTLKNIDMKNQESYQFTSSAADAIDRFIISFSPVGVESANDLDANIFSYGKTITIVSTKCNLEVEIIDINGRIIAQSITNANEFTLNVEQTGVYVVRVTNANATKVEKVIIR